ncbi:MAG: helix-turn-helix transcriptional regulator [Marinoscillum sp.]
METATKSPRPHIGRKISRIRELRGMKQEALTYELGITQQAVSKIEQSETVEEDTLDKVAKALGVSKQALENFTEEALFLHIENINDHGVGVNYNCTFNPIDKIVALYDEKMVLMERLLKAEKEKVEMLEKMMKGE